jgi:DNA-binding IclR family transcriptional regulator
MAVPVRWLDGPGTAALNVSLPATRVSDDVRERIVEHLLETAREISGPGPRQ